ncbi:MAG: hypothetical protein SOU19_05965 [Candidatus Caccosoma sp.]|nr:hypothetical protein [Candidatus Caccosoma sp.]
MIIKVIHLCCIALALIVALFVSLSIDYSKFIKAKSNVDYYLAAFAVCASLTYLIEEFLFTIITLFIN